MAGSAAMTFVSRGGHAGAGPVAIAFTVCVQTTTAFIYHNEEMGANKKIIYINYVKFQG